jgi:hypothetical protein
MPIIQSYVCHTLRRRHPQLERNNKYAASWRLERIVSLECDTGDARPLGCREDSKGCGYTGFI